METSLVGDISKFRRYRARITREAALLVALGLRRLAQVFGATIDGESIIRNATPVRRAHPNFVENLRSLGADVEWVDAWDLTSQVQEEAP